MSSEILAPITIHEPNDKINQEIQAKGYCCTYAYFMQHQDYYTKEELSDILGVSPETIKKARRRLRDGKIFCRELPNCDPKFKKELKLPGDTTI